MLRKIASLTIVPLVLLLWARFGAQNLALYSFNALVKYPSPYLGTIAPGKEGEAISRQVVLVVVDALRVDSSRTLPGINALRDRGADRTLQVGLPSFSLPGWTVIGTGAWQETSGVTLNFYDQDIKVDTIFEAAKRKGLTTAIVGEGDHWKKLYARGVDTHLGVADPPNAHTDLAAVLKQDDAIEAMALQILKETKPNLLLVHFVATDDMGHGYGGASAQYKQALTLADARIARITATLDLKDATILVTGDHGTLDKGGHGGAEPDVLAVPLVAAGRGIQPGKLGQATQADIAPTLAVLLGTAIPAHNQGVPLFDMLDVDARVRAQRAVDAAQQIADRYAQMAQVVGAAPFDHKQLEQAKQALASGNLEGALAAARADIESTRAQFERARAARLFQERVNRLPLAVLLMLPFLAYVFVYRRAGWDWRIPLIATVIYFVVYNGLFFGRGFTWSLSVFNTEEQIASFFTERTIDAMIALLAATIAVGIQSRRLAAYATVLNVVNMAFFTFALLAIQIALFYVLYDFAWSWFLPDLTLGFKYYLDVLQTGAFWPLLYVPLLVLLPPIALGTRRVVRQFPHKDS